MKFIERIKNLIRAEEQISDGYHTFGELYEYRLLYNAALFNCLTRHGNKFHVHKSKRHSNGEPCFGGEYFIVMATLPTGQISNHYEMRYWNLFHIPEHKVADKWDGHTPQQAANRLFNLLNIKSGMWPYEAAIPDPLID